MTQCFTNGTVMLQYGAKTNIYNMRRKIPYKFDTNVENFNPKSIEDTVNI